MDPNDLDPRFAHLGRDLLLTPFFQAADGDQLDIATNPRGLVTRDDRVDFDRAAGPGALKQALVLRLLTPVGSLSELAHPDYGSRLGELIGEISTPFTRAKARAFVLEALAAERRVAKVLAVDVRTAEGATDRLLIDVQVVAVGGGDPVSLGLEVAL
jgi:phage baseplate assembly protein W